MSEIRDLAYQDYLAGMKYQDIADKYSVSLSAVKSWATRYWKKGCDQDKKVATKKEKKLQPKVATIEKGKTVVADEVKSVMENARLTEKQRLFCIYYIRSFNATKAYQKAYGCSYLVANAEGYKLLVNPCIKEEIMRMKQERLNREFLTESDIFQKYMDIAFADITDFTEFGNEEIEITDDDGQKRKIKVNHVNIKNSNEVDGTLIAEVSTGKAGTKIKLADRMKALQWLSDHMDLATDEQKARIALLKAKSQDNNEEDIADDGFLEALNASAGEDWSDEED